LAVSPLENRAITSQVLFSGSMVWPPGSAMLGDGCEIWLPCACQAFLKKLRMPATRFAGATPSRIAFMFASSGNTLGRLLVCWYRPALAFNSGR
jgi:hypothetical protein